LNIARKVLWERESLGDRRGARDRELNMTIRGGRGGLCARMGGKKSGEKGQPAPVPSWGEKELGGKKKYQTKRGL